VRIPDEGRTRVYEMRGMTAFCLFYRSSEKKVQHAAILSLTLQIVKGFIYGVKSKEILVNLN